MCCCVLSVLQRDAVLFRVLQFVAVYFKEGLKDTADDAGVCVWTCVRVYVCLCGWSGTDAGQSY